MNETDMILSALRAKPPKSVPKKFIRELEPDLFSDHEFMKLATEKSKKKILPLKKWSNSQFFEYFVSALKPYGIRVHGKSLNQTEVFSTVYDHFVRILNEKMNNTILKDYIDWWVSHQHKRFFNKMVFTHSLRDEQLIAKFVQRFNSIDSKAFEPTPVVVDSQSDDKVDEKTLYDVGGLSMLLRRRGIVIACRVLSGEKQDWILSVSSALRNMSKETVIEVLDVTVRGAPYEKTDIVDFISLARSALDYYGIKSYDKLQYGTFFQ